MELIRNLGIRNRWFANILGALLAFSTLSARAETDPKFYAVMTHAEVQASPARITLKWNSDPNATGYSVARRNGNSWGEVASVSGSTLSWTDPNVSVGATYEYRITKTTSQGYKGASFLLAGINAPLKDNLGKVILVVDNTYASQLSAELQRLEYDLAGDGWTVLRRDVSRNDSVQNVKNVIRDAYNSDPSNVKSVFLFGHVPVPYSGNLAPDGHPDHVGAWAADLYYGDMDGNWTDSSVNNTGAHKPWNHNRPGDGKFDQSNMPSDVELAVGRVDFHNMTCYANKTPARSELDLLRNYLNKDHNFRHRVFTVARRGLVCDNFGEFQGEAFAASGWRNFGAFFGADNVTKVSYGNYFSTLASQDYLWSYGTGGGSWYTCNGIGSSDDFATTEIRSVFTMFLGSYFGDWDNESAFLRAPLGSGYALTASWAGRPHWFYHQMGLGEPIGVSTVASQNNIYGSAIDNGGWYSRQVHAALLGDPTLRMHPVVPVSNLQGTPSGNTMTLQWNASTDSNLQGYHVYRGSGPRGAFTRLTSSPITATSFTDANYSSGAVYMVRAIKLEQSGSGTYFNASQGIFYPANSGTGGEPLPQTPSPAANLAAAPVSASQVNLSWQDASNNEAGFRIDRRTGTSGSWSQLATVGANVTTYSSTGLSPGTAYYYRVTAFNNSGSAMPSNEASATTSVPNAAAPGATFAATDTTTVGNWRGVIGKDGYNIPTSGASLPGYVTMNVVGGAPYQWSDWNTETRALQNAANNGRVASCWFADESFHVDFNFIDGQTHKLSLYFADWDRTGRAQKIEVLDAISGALLDTRTLSNFANGVYLAWNVKGSIRIRITKTAGNNAVLNGIFFDPPTGSAGGGGTGGNNSQIGGGLVSGKFNLQINGSIGQKFDIYYTENLTTWQKLTTVTLTAPVFDFLDTAANGRPLRFYRAAAVP